MQDSDLSSMTRVSERSWTKNSVDLESLGTRESEYITNLHEELAKERERRKTAEQELERIRTATASARTAS